MEESVIDLEKKWISAYEKYKNAKNDSDQSTMEKWYKQLTEVEKKLHSILYSDKD
tara:strand:- start:537 stop:701 length:165 start_codon:yes stop_codon:yes gene_type:complete